MLGSLICFQRIHHPLFEPISTLCNKPSGFFFPSYDFIFIALKIILVIWLIVISKKNQKLQRKY